MKNKSGIFFLSALVIVGSFSACKGTKETSSDASSSVNSNVSENVTSSVSSSSVNSVTETKTSSSSYVSSSSSSSSVTSITSNTSLSSSSSEETSSSSSSSEEEKNKLKKAYEAACLLANKAESSSSYEYEGVITTFIGNSFFVQNEGYGMYVYSSSKMEGTEVGKTIRIDSTVKNYNGCIETGTVNSFEILGDGDLPDPVIVSSSSDLTSLPQNILINIRVTMPEALSVWSSSKTSNTAVSFEEGSLVTASFQKFAYSEDKGTLYNSLASKDTCFQRAVTTSYSTTGTTSSNQFFVTTYTTFSEYKKSGWVSSSSAHWKIDGNYEIVYKDNHDFDEGIVKEEPSYDNDGKKVYTCSVCGYEKEEAITKLAHNYSSEYSYNETSHWQNCTDEGYTSLKTNEGEHDYQDTTVTQVTCSQDGYIHHQCKTCAYFYDEPYGTGQHNYSYEKDTEGHWKVCSSCTAVTEKEIHAFDGGVIKEEPSYDNDGKKVYTCSVCGYEKEETIAKLSHNYSSEYDSDDTNHWHNCTDAGYTNLKSGVEAHNFESEEIGGSSCLEDYIMRYTCSDCGYTYDDPMGEKGPHSYQSSYNYNAEGHWHTCTLCDETDELSQHNFLNNFESKVSTCSECGYSCPIISVEFSNYLTAGTDFDFSTVNVSMGSFSGFTYKGTIFSITHTPEDGSDEESQYLVSDIEDYNIISVPSCTQSDSYAVGILFSLSSELDISSYEGLEDSELMDALNADLDAYGLYMSEEGEIYGVRVYINGTFVSAGRLASDEFIVGYIVEEAGTVQ